MQIQIRLYEDLDEAISWYKTYRSLQLRFWDRVTHRNYHQFHLTPSDRQATGGPTQRQGPLAGCCSGCCYTGFVLVSSYLPFTIAKFADYVSLMQTECKESNPESTDVGVPVSSNITKTCWKKEEKGME